MCVSLEWWSIKQVLIVFTRHQHWDPRGKDLVSASSGANRWVGIKTFASCEQAAAYAAEASGGKVNHFAATSYTSTSTALYV
jgi:hypothetical protein